MQEVKALEALSNALANLVKTHAMKYIRAEIIRHTVLATLMSGLVPLAWLKIGKIIGEILPARCARSQVSDT